MICSIGDNILSPLGFTSSENWNAVCSGHSALKQYADHFDLPEPFCASLLDWEKVDEKFAQLPNNHLENYTHLEKIAILSAADAFQKAGINPAAEDVLFVLSTTKGNVELLQDLQDYEPSRPYLWRSAQLIARYFGNANEPIVVSNACISGCAALHLVKPLLQKHGFRYVVVIGADVLSKFIISGFQSFKALSPDFCRPFDADRTGLNLGEAAATIIFAEMAETKMDTIGIVASALCNDANHISAPSRTAEGLLKTLKSVVSAEKDLSVSDIAFVNAHGTATRYNDDMESVALDRMGWNKLTVNSLKGYFGHTLGAAGVLETVISSRELLNGQILPTIGTQNPGTVAEIHVSLQPEKTDKPLFVKMISGFGGSNAAVLFTKFLAV